MSHSDEPSRSEEISPAVNMDASYDKVSANTASSFPQCFEKYDGSQDKRRGSPDIPN